MTPIRKKKRWGIMSMMIGHRRKIHSACVIAFIGVGAALLNWQRNMSNHPAQAIQNDLVPSNRVSKHITEDESAPTMTGNDEDLFPRAAESPEPTADGVASREYRTMYGQFLLPRYRSKPGMKFLEMGPGCGASAAPWKEILPRAELWGAEPSGDCVRKSNSEGKMEGINVSVGDRVDVDALDRWIRESKGGFDVVVDDGGRENCQIWTSFQRLWPELFPGGLYFLEGLSSRIQAPHSGPTCGEDNATMPDILKQKMDEVIHRNQTGAIDDVKFIFCQRDACVVGKRERGRTSIRNEALFLRSAETTRTRTDKVGHHEYQIMYGQFLVPYHRRKPGMKLLEIGLGCGMSYGPGRSAALWKSMLPGAELWEAERDGDCVRRWKAERRMDGFNVLIGDQMDVDALDRWIVESGGGFDVVVDDGGHQNCQIWTSLQRLWPELLPGGLYFVEDLMISRVQAPRSSPICDAGVNVPDILKQKVDRVIHGNQEGTFDDIEFIFCQRDACVLGKRGYGDINDMNTATLPS